MLSQLALASAPDTTLSYRQIQKHVMSMLKHSPCGITYRWRWMHHDHSRSWQAVMPACTVSRTCVGDAGSTSAVPRLQKRCRFTQRPHVGDVKGSRYIFDFFNMFSPTVVLYF